jgi:hypothetical protein
MSFGICIRDGLELVIVPRRRILRIELVRERGTPSIISKISAAYKVAATEGEARKSGCCLFLSGNGVDKSA